MSDYTNAYLSDTSEGEEFKTAGQKAYDIIFKKIINGEFTPGFKLSRRKMAEVTGVSVIPVIEALNKLEEDGLVESKPQWGSFVTVPTPKKIEDMYILREAIECQVARIMATKMTDSQEQQLRKIAKALDSLKFSKDTHTDISKMHYLFHSKLTDFTEVDSLKITLRRTNLFYLLYKAVSVTRVNEMAGPRYWHELLIDEIRSKDADRAEAAMRVHINESLKYLREDF